MGFPVRLRQYMIAAALLSVVLAHAADSGAGCRVADPELQGRYAGPCVNGWAQGRGEAVGTARYVGDFVAGRKQGRGVKTWPNGDRYEGEFVGDRRHGQGIYVWGAGTAWAGQRYSGGYVADLRQGVGTYEWPDGRRLTGQWHNDLPSPALAARMPQTVMAHAERLALNAVPGARVCRGVPVGISEIDVLRGVVLAVERERLRIRIDQPGRLGAAIDGRLPKAGDIVNDDAGNWSRCS